MTSGAPSDPGTETSAVDAIASQDRDAIASQDGASALNAAHAATATADLQTAPPTQVGTEPEADTLPGEVPDAATGEGSKRKGKERKGGWAFLRELPVLLLVAFLLALLIKTFLIQAFYIPSESMENTLKVGDRVLVNKLVYHFHPPRRGDIIVFEDPHPGPQPHRNPVSSFWHWLTQGLGVSTSPEKDFIKRVIGLPGDTVEMRQGVVYVNGKALTEPYLNPTRDVRDFPPHKVPAGTLFVMGDNRTNSNDSRFSLGYIPMDKVVGRAFVIIWPPSRIRWLSGIHYS